MGKNNGNMPAMPCIWVDENSGDAYREYGFTKREYFAGLAMQALVSALEWERNELSREAVKIAEALLNQLQATEDGE